MSHFDYENAERDIFDAGGDPDYLSHYNEAARDNYLKKMGMNPSDYGGGRTAEPKSRRAGVSQYSSSDAQADYSWPSSGMSSSQRRHSLKEDRQARELEEYMSKTPDEVARDTAILKTIAILFAIFLLFFGVIRGF